LVHLDHDAADRPNIDPAVLVLTAHQNFRRPLPQCHHLVRIWPGREAVCPCESEVSQFHCVVFQVDKYVLRLEVTVYNASFVALLQSYQHLPSELTQCFIVHLKFFGFNWFLYIVDYVFLKILVTEFKHQVEC
jgi:hypothetical protein